MTKGITLPNGCITYVDDDDYEVLAEIKWHVITSSVNGRMYVYSKLVGMMSRFILSTPPNLQADHINGNTLDNRRSNLRNATVTQNGANKKKYSRGSVTKSTYKGVDWYERYSKWRARISCQNKTYHLGYYTTAEEAAGAYNELALALFGEFAVLNEI